MTVKQAMLCAKTADEHGIPTRAELEPHLPLYGSDKLDGIRAINENQQLVTRNWKPIRSLFAQQRFGAQGWAADFDGELLSPEWNDSETTLFHESQSRAMTMGDMRPLHWFVFDWIGNPELEFYRRYAKLAEYGVASDFCTILPQKELYTYEDVLAYEQEAVEQRGAEGIVIRRGDRPYKFGRSTLREGGLIKFTRWECIEGEITDFEEQYANENPATIDRFGRIERSTHKAGKRPKGTLGAFRVRTERFGDFSVGGGPLLTAKSRAHFWAIRHEILGSLLNIRFKPYGVKDKPRFPQAFGIRHRDDV